MTAARRPASVIGTLSRFPVAQIMRVQTGPRWAIGARSASTSKSAVSRRFVSRSDVAAGGATAVR